MWQLVFRVYISLFFTGRLYPQCVPRKLRPLLFIPNNSLPNPDSSSSELIPFNSNSALVPETLQPSKYDVFISFRGGDVRNNFLSHLYAHLNDHKKLLTYKDDVDLQRGQEISPSLLRAIEVSDVYVVILSPKYTDSPWCLEELVKILECKERHGRRVIPVFYGVDPSDVESQMLPSSTAGNIQSWRAALCEIANLSGFDSQVIRPETKLIDEIVTAVFQAIRGSSSSQMVEYSSYSASRGLVGVERKMEQVEALLCLADRSNRTIGLWGMVGIGKTVLARAFFDLFSCQFEASYFFGNFADAIASGLTRQPFGNVQNEFFSKLLGDENGRAGGTSSYDLTLHRLGRMKVLVVIDDVGNDVDNVGPLKDLLNGQYCDLFGSGSVIIMTSRNQQLLKSVCHHVYEVEPLYGGEDLRLFCLHAFREDNVQTEYLEMVERAIGYLGGNPLAITVLGAHLFGRDLKFWDLELRALQDNPSSVVENVLRRSYDGLSRAEKSVFLDIACFSYQWDLERLERMEEILLGGGKVNVITNLVDKCFLVIGDYPFIQMEILVRDLGRNIVNEECQVEKRSRVWEVEDVHYLFRENKGTKYTEGIFLQRHGFREPDLHLQPDTFMKMKRLRFFVIRGFVSHLILPEDGLKCLPNALRILVWQYFGSKYLPSQFSAGNLVLLDLQDSKIEQLWGGDQLNVDLRNLKSLILRGSKSRRKLPNLSTATRLEDIDLYECESLVELPTSFLDLPKLESLDVRGCSSLKWDNLQDRSSRHSDILPNLKKLDLNGTRIQKVPNSITRLHILELELCRELTEFPVISSLEKLSLTGSLIKEVVELEKLTWLKHLNLSENKQLVLISGDFSKLKSLEEIHLNGCTKLSLLPDSFGNLIRLSKLRLKGCKSLASLPSTIHKLPELDTLDLVGCDQLKHLPELPSSLKNLDAGSCRSLETLPIDIVEKHDFTNTNWRFANCWKLDRRVCSKLVDKFTRDSVRSLGDSTLVLPAIWGCESGGEEESTMGSKDGNNNTMVTAKLRGQPWKPKSTIFCALLNSLDPLLIKKHHGYSVECVIFNNKDKDGAKDRGSYCRWNPFQEYEDQEKEDRLSNRGHFLVWSTTGGPLVAAENVDDASTIKFLFEGSYRTRDGYETYEIPNMIKDCQVIPIYDDRVVTTEDDEEEKDDDDDDESPNDLQGLYYQMCGHW